MKWSLHKLARMEFELRSIREGNSTQCPTGDELRSIREGNSTQCPTGEEPLSIHEDTDKRDKVAGLKVDITPSDIEMELGTESREPERTSSKDVLMLESGGLKSAQEDNCMGAEVVDVKSNRMPSSIGTSRSAGRGPGTTTMLKKSGGLKSVPGDTYKEAQVADVKIKQHWNVQICRPGAWNYHYAEEVRGTQKCAWGHL